MTVRTRITLLITAPGLLASLIFSGIVLWEMTEEQFHTVDGELLTVARQTARLGSATSPDGTPIRQQLDDGQYWIRITDEQGRDTYHSELAGQITIDPPHPGHETLAMAEQPGSRKHPETVPFRIRTVTMPMDGQPVHITVGRSVERFGHEFIDTALGIVSGLGVSLIALLAISYVIAGLMLRPVRHMSGLVRDISEQHLDRRLPETGTRDEFDTLAHLLNQVFDRLQHAFARQKQLLADASHELKTPLTMIRLATDALQQSTGTAQDDAQHREHLTRQVLRMDRLVKSLLDLSALEAESGVPDTVVHVSDLIGELEHEYRLLADSRAIAIDSSLPAGLATCGYEDKLTRAFSNLLDNAVKYTPDHGEIRITGSRSDAEIRVAIANTGPGVAETGRVFEQFYRAEASRATRHGGVGLGLAIVRRIITLHRGQVWMESTPGAWTTVHVRLPISGSER